MHIGIYTECLNRPFTGVETHTYNLLFGLSQTKHQITCHHTQNPNHPNLQNIKHHLFRKPLPIPFYQRFAALFHNTWDTDILHLPYPHPPYVKQPKIPVAITVHDIIPVLFPHYHNWKRTLFFKHVLPAYLRKARLILASSHATKTDLIKHFRLPHDKIRVVHIGIPLDQYHPSPAKDPYILSLGTLEPRKNVEGLLKAYAILKSKGYKQKLVIAGTKGWNYQSIFTLIQTLNLQNDVIYKGYISEQEKRELYQKASLFAYPSFYEGFGIPILEAMASGTPVVTSNTSSLPEVAGDAAILVNPHSPEHIARGMIEALENQTPLARHGLQRARQFTVQRMTAQTLEAYEEILP